MGGACKFCVWESILTAQTDVIVVHQTVNGVKLSANVVVFSALIEIADGGMLWVTAEDELGLLLPIGSQYMEQMVD